MSIDVLVSSLGSSLPNTLPNNIEEPSGGSLEVLPKFVRVGEFMRFSEGSSISLRGSCSVELYSVALIVSIVEIASASTSSASTSAIFAVAMEFASALISASISSSDFDCKVMSMLILSVGLKPFRSRMSFAVLNCTAYGALPEGLRIRSKALKADEFMLINCFRTSKVFSFDLSCRPPM